MSERPILFSGPMIRAILDGRKTQTRRVLKPQPEAGQRAARYATAKIDWQVQDKDGLPVSSHRFPYQVGDRLWVREAWQTEDCYDATRPKDIPRTARINYLATSDDIGTRHRSSIHMPRWASRITLEVTGVKIERLHEISEADAEAEGVEVVDGCDHPRRSCADVGCMGPTHRAAFCDLWNTINGPGSWDQNRWVVAYSFRVIKPEARDAAA